VKYGGETPILQLGSCLEENGFARFWVSDNGQGISIAEQSKLFQPFSRVGENEATGHGLGLSIVQRIIHKLGGDVGVESDVGKGSTFYFTLPQFS
jgi:signal transduction histidine kinase